MCFTRLRDRATQELVANEKVRSGTMASGSAKRSEEIEILLEEYRALYGLLHGRLSALERRIPVGGVAVAGFLTAAAGLDSIARSVILLGLPVASAWFLQTTSNHARSFEDLLRRIEAIERAVNIRAGEELLIFQSRHPSRHRAVGGRIGQGAVLTAFIGVLSAIGACAVIAWTDSGIPKTGLFIYLAYLTAVTLLGAAMLLKLRKYVYGGEPRANAEER